jgi:hypothetical protein
LIGTLAKSRRHRLLGAIRRSGRCVPGAEEEKDFDGKSFPFCRKGKTCTAEDSRNT